MNTVRDTVEGYNEDLSLLLRQPRGMKDLICRWTKIKLIFLLTFHLLL